MSELLKSLVYWHWLILGLALMTAEAIIPGSFLLWFGVGALVTGIALLIAPTLIWQLQLILFALVSGASIVLWRRYRAANPETSSHPTLNQRGAQYIGRRFTLAEPIVDGIGRLHVDDTQWRVEGPDLPAGTPVSVTGCDGNVLKISAIQSTSQ